MKNKIIYEENTIIRLPGSLPSKYKRFFLDFTLIVLALVLYSSAFKWQLNDGRWLIYYVGGRIPFFVKKVYGNF